MKNDFEKEAKAVYDDIQNYMCETPAWTFIAQALARAYENGKKESHSNLERQVAYDSGYDYGYNSAIDEAVNTYEKYNDDLNNRECLEKLKELRKGVRNV